MALAEILGGSGASSTEDFLNILSPSGTASALTGVGAASAAEEAASAQEAASLQAFQTLLSDLEPFKDLGTATIPRIQELTALDANEQFLTNPLLQFTSGFAEDALRGNKAVGFLDSTARGLEERRLGMTPNLVDEQLNRMIPLLNFGQASAAQTGTGGADILSGIGDIQAASGIGQANAQAQGASNIASLATTAISLFSDPRLKDDVEKIGTYNGLNVYTWTWNDKASGLGLSGTSTGHLANEVKEKHPQLVFERDGYDTVLYGVDGKTMEAQ